MASAEAQDLKARRIDPANPTVLGSAITVATGVMNIGQPREQIDSYVNGAKFEVLGLNDRLAIAYSEGVVMTNGVWRLATYVSSSLTRVGTVTVGSLTGFASPVAMWSDSSQNIWLAGCRGPAGEVGPSPLVAHVYTKNLATVMTATNVASSSLSTVRMAGICASGSRSSLYYETIDTADPAFTTGYLDWATGLYSRPFLNRTINVVSFTLSASVAASASFRRGVAIDSYPFAWDGSHYLWTFHDSEVQPTYFLLDSDGQVASKANIGLGGRARSNLFPSHVASPRSGSFLVATQRTGRLLAESGSLFSLPGCAGTTVDFRTTTGSFWTAQLGKQLHCVGGMLSSYDGFNFVEHGFHTYPERLSSSINYEDSTGELCSGSYQYRAVFAWTDAYGQLHRSRPSAPITVDIPSGSMLTGSVDISLPTLRLTAKEARSPVAIEIYRTEDLGQVFYKVTPTTSSFFNSASADLVTFRDRLNDADIIGRELLYTESGVLENDAPPACTMIETWQNRLWLAGLEDPNTVRYSKRSVFGEAVGFSDYFEVRVDPAGGDITAIKALAENLIVFKERSLHRIYPLTGDGTPYGGGPDNTGAGGEWGQAPIASDVGCVNANSVERTDLGIFFRSAKGIYLLGRDLSLRYIGAPVEGFNDLTITSANLVAAQNQVRFSTSDGVCLVYDYVADQWSTFTNHESVDAAVVAGTYMVLRSSGRVDVENTTSFADNAAAIKLKLVTGWLSLAGIQNYQRVRRVYVLGDYRGRHQLKAKVGYDFKSAFDDETTIDAQSVVDPTGNETYATEDGELYQFRFDLSRQKCTAIRLSVEDVQTSGFNEGLRLSNLSVEVGVKRGGNKVRPGRQAGTE